MELSMQLTINNRKITGLKSRIGASWHYIIASSHLLYTIINHNINTSTGHSNLRIKNYIAKPTIFKMHNMFQHAKNYCFHFLNDLP